MDSVHGVRIHPRREAHQEAIQSERVYTPTSVYLYWLWGITCTDTNWVEFSIFFDRSRRTVWLIIYHDIGNGVCVLNLYECDQRWCRLALCAVARVLQTLSNGIDCTVDTAQARLPAAVIPIVWKGGLLSQRAIRSVAYSRYVGGTGGSTPCIIPVPL